MIYGWGWAGVKVIKRLLAAGDSKHSLRDNETGLQSSSNICGQLVGWDMLHKTYQWTVCEIISSNQFLITRALHFAQPRQAYYQA